MAALSEPRNFSTPSGRRARADREAELGSIVGSSVRAWPFHCFSNLLLSQPYRTRRSRAVTGGVASSAPMRAGTRVRLTCALTHALLMRFSVYWRVGRVISIRVGVLLRRSTKVSECLLRSAVEIAL